MGRGAVQGFRVGVFPDPDSHHHPFLHDSAARVLRLISKVPLHQYEVVPVVAKGFDAKALAS